MTKQVPGTTYYNDNDVTIVGDAIQTLWTVATRKTPRGIRVLKSPSGFSFKYFSNGEIEIYPALAFGEVVQLQLTYGQEG